MVKFCSLPARGTWLWGIKPEEQYYLLIDSLEKFLLDDPTVENPSSGFLKPYLNDMFLKFYKWDVTILPYGYGDEFAVVTFTTEKQVQRITSWKFKTVENVYISENLYLQITQINQNWRHLEVLYKDGSKEVIDMEIFRPYRTRSAKPLPPEQKIETVKVVLNPPFF
jgi:hypothetical protein